MNMQRKTDNMTTREFDGIQVSMPSPHDTKAVLVVFPKFGCNNPFNFGSYLRSFNNAAFFLKQVQYRYPSFATEEFGLMQD